MRRIYLTRKGEMNEQSYENQEIIEYLLGSLSPAETERFDELSITSEGFAGALDAAENELIDAYARGELAGDALDKFQSFYLASPLRRKKVKFAETFQIYGKQNAEKKAENLISAETKPEHTNDGFFSSLKFFKNQSSLLRLGLAFGALLLVISSGFWFLNNRAGVETAKQNSRSNIQTEPSKQIGEKQSANTNNEIAAVNSGNESAAPLPANKLPKKNSNFQATQTPTPEKATAPPKNFVATFVLAPSMRGSSEVKSLSIPKQTIAINMQLELEADDFPVYRVALTDESGGVNLWQSGKVKAAATGENKHLKIQFPAKLLKSKIYSLVVSGINSGGEPEIIGSYTFRSVLK